MRIVLFAVVAVGLAAAILHLSARYPAMRAGFDLPIGQMLGVLGFVALGMLAARAGEVGVAAALGVGMVATAVGAVLTGQGLELPRPAAVAFGAMTLAAGLAAAGRQPKGAAVLVAAVCGLATAHRLTDPVGAGAAEPLYVAGLGAAALCLMLGGVLASLVATRLEPGLDEKIAAGVAGVGLYATLGAVGLAG